MAKGRYAVIGGATRKVKKRYAVVDGVTRKVKKRYAVVNGVTKLIWSGANANKLVVAVHQTASNSTLCSNFFTAEDFKSPTNPVITNINSNAYISNGYLLEDTYVFPSNGWEAYHCDADATVLSYTDLSTSSTSGFVIENTGLDRDTGTMYGMYIDKMTIGGGPGGSGGQTQLYLRWLTKDFEAGTARLTADYPPTSGDTRPSFDWSTSYGGTGSSGNSCLFGNISVYNNKAYVVMLKHNWSSSLNFTPSLYAVDLSTKTLSEVASLSKVTYSGYTTESINRYTISFSDGLLMFIDKAVYKLDGTSLTKLKDVYTAGYPGGYYGDRVIRIDATKFLITNANGNTTTGYLYEFKNGSLTLLNTLTVLNNTNDAVNVGGALVFMYTHPDNSDNSKLYYSLDYGVTYTTNTISNDSIGVTPASSTKLHTIAETIY